MKVSVLAYYALVVTSVAEDRCEYRVISDSFRSQSTDCVLHPYSCLQCFVYAVITGRDSLPSSLQHGDSSLFIVPFSRDVKKSLK